MVAEVYYPNDLKSSLLKTEWIASGIYGFLTGKMVDEKLYVLNVWKTPVVNTNRLYNVFQQCHSHLPAGTEIVGVVVATHLVTRDVLEDELQALPLEVQTALSADPFVVCAIQQQSQKEPEISFHQVDSSRKFVKLTEKTDIDCIFRNQVTFRVKAHIPLQLQLDNNKQDESETWSEKITKAVSNTDLSVVSGSYSYGISETTVFLSESGVVGPRNLHTCEDLFRYLDESSGITSSRKKQLPLDCPPVYVDMYQQVSGTTDRFAQPTCAPAVHHKAGTFRSVKLSLPLDVIVEVDVDCKLGELPEIFSKAVRVQLQAMRQCLHQYYNESEFHIPEPFHFLIAQRHSCITVIYPRGVSEKDLERQRRTLHQHMCLTLEAPLFRRANARIFPGQTAIGGYIINPHRGLPPSGVAGGKSHLVQGNYTYHHYMQDRFDDDKWGCAYRSLQTLFSWFRFQGYTDRSIPTHREIQQALVDVGDKDQMFVGSRKWIGSFEVSYCLDHLIGITSKFLNVQAGTEMATKGRELAQHFDTQGTPVMIGGGVLAHTILGVDYNESTGDIKFLILDPHYTGGEDLQIIQKEGWCGWKGPNFWVPTAHYNMCMPQRPNMF